MLAGISVEYYTQLERGSVRGVSEDVARRDRRALQLDDVERTHLFDLVRAAKQRPPHADDRPTSTPQRAARPRHHHRGRRLRAQRPPGHPLRQPPRLRPLLRGLRQPHRPVNLARFVFLEPRAREFYRDWDGIADAGVGSLRAEAGRDPYDRDLTELVGELAMRSDDFLAAGPLRTSASTAAGPNPSATPSLVTSRSVTKPSSSPPTWASHSSCMPPNPTRHRNTHSTTSRTGPRRRMRCRSARLGNSRTVKPTSQRSSATLPSSDSRAPKCFGSTAGTPTRCRRGKRTFRAGARHKP